jgi:uncharacterized protein (TIGR02246 family)
MGSDELYGKYIAGMNDGDPAAVAALFADDGVYVEPFSTGTPNEVRGRAAIEEYFRQSVQMRPKDMTVSVDRIDVDGELVRTKWTCSSADWDAPMQGSDEMRVGDGRIKRLEVHLEAGDHP